MPPGVSYLADGVSISGNYITSAAGSTFRVTDLGVTYVLDKAGNVLDIGGEGSLFILDTATNEVFRGADVVMNYAGEAIKASYLLPGGKYYEIFKQLKGVGSTLNQIALSLNGIVTNVNSIVNELGDWL